MNTNYLKLCLVTHAENVTLSQYIKFITQAIQGGITSVQVREKSQNMTRFYHLAFTLKTLLQPFNIPLIINDHVGLAKEIDADGVHLGQSDQHPYEARKQLGPYKIIGLSIESLDELKKANQLKCINYVAASAVFPSTTKTNCKTLWGLAGLHQFIQLSKHPVIAIGGINLRNIKQVFDQGVSGAAVISAIHSQQNPEKATLALNKQIQLSWSDKHV